MSKSVYENDYQSSKPDFIVTSTPLSKKLRHSQFNSSESKTAFDGILRKNPRSSFHAQKLRKNQSRPQSSFPQPNQNQLRIEQPRNIGVMGSFFINTKPNTRRISNSLASYQAQLMKRNQSQNANAVNVRNSKIKSQRTPVSSNIINASVNVNVCQRNSAKKAPVNLYDDIVFDVGQYFSLIRSHANIRNSINAIKEKGDMLQANAKQEKLRDSVMDSQQLQAQNQTKQVIRALKRTQKANSFKRVDNKSLQTK